MNRASLLVALYVVAHLTSFALHAAEPSQPVNFNRDIRPLLAKNCFACHGPDEAHREAGLRLDVRDAAIGELDSGSKAIVPGSAEESELLARITSTDESVRMPPADTGIVLQPEQIDLIRRWIAGGAEYSQHWSLAPPRRSPLPEVQDEKWPAGAIDRFILSSLESAGLQPSPEADRHILIRRVTLDLTGLPPTPEEVKAFVTDESPDSYERLVDRLLDSPPYGERWARMWLDLARYADSAGHGSDPLRTIWRYRDWVIDALNQNMPYDQFTREQLAGDLMPSPTHEQLVATAFHRNTMTNTEGGTDDEEFRIAAVKDRIDTTVQVWMGLTFGCAQCHTHKYDPISHRDYYSMFAFFNQTADNDQPNEAPTIASPTAAIKEQMAGIDAKVVELKTQLNTSTPELIAAQTNWEAGLKPQGQWHVLQPAELASENGTILQPQADGTVLASGPAPATEAYTLTSKTNLQNLTGLRLEVLPHESLKGAVGRAADGNFVLSRISITAQDTASSAKRGRYVRVEIPGDNQLLSLAEVQVLSGSENVAKAGKATQASTAFEGRAELAIDGNTDGRYYEAMSTTHTDRQANPWWEVDLGTMRPVDSVVIWNRTDGNVGSRLAKFRISVLDEGRKAVWEEDVAQAPSPSSSFVLGGPRRVPIPHAAADFSQDGFAVMTAIDDKDLSERGWALAPQQKMPHSAVFTFGSPVGESPDTLLNVKLEHRFKDPGYTVGHFRLSVTDDPAVGRRASLPSDMLAIVDTPTDSRSEEQRNRLAEYYRSIAPELKPVRDQIAALEKSRPTVPTVPVMQEVAAEKRRATHILLKGNFLEKGDAVEPAVPAALHALPHDAPKNRLGVAMWLMDPQNPLTARVAMNRYGSQLFGVGLVETEEDFGTQGELPSHPELLDWLATEFMASGWNMKAMLRMIVTSRTYRQSSRITPEQLEKDPRNRLLSRAPSFRLEAEMVRDQALALSGLLSRKIGGPSVFPPQPPNLWQAAFNGERTWATSTGEDRWRRGLYTFWRRTVPYPSMATFDAPSREICSVRRIRTSTPLQAFVTLNDPVFVEAAQALARRIVREGGQTPEERAAFGLQLCLARPAHPDQIVSLTELYRTELNHYQNDTKAAEKLATDPLGPLPEGASAPELAAWTVVSNVLLNMDGVLTKR